MAYGTRESATFNFIFKGANIVLIIIILCLSFPHANKQNWADFWHFGDAGVFGAAAVVFFAYNGAPEPLARRSAWVLFFGKGRITMQWPLAHMDCIRRV